MAVDLNDPDHSLHRLPSEFVDQDYDAALRSVNKPISHRANSWSWFGSSDSGSALSSPVESELGSTETDSDPDEDYMAELMRQMADNMLQEDDKQERSWASVVSPQSTLRSPPLPNIIEEFDKMKINNKDMPRYNFTEIPSTVRNSNIEFHCKQALIDRQVQAIQKYYKLNLKQEQSMKQNEQKKQLKQIQNKHRSSAGFNDSQKANIPPPGSNSTTCSDMQQQPSSGMRAVLNGSGSRTGSSGTGVFMPQVTCYSSEIRKKKGCSTVLIPARVVQALKQHFDKVGVQSRFSETLPMQNDGLMGGNNSLYSHQRPQSGAAPASNHQEMNLPQEWTY